MSLNTILLPPQLVAGLYHHTLVGGTATGMPQKPPVPFLGKAGKNILIVVNKPDAPHLPDNELAFLTKVLMACQLGLADAAIINWSNMPHHDIAAIMNQFSAKSVILFDIEPTHFHLPSGLPLYTVHSFEGRQFVAAPALKEIEKTKEAKGQLWLVLKQLFCI
jgi:DNA polymerase III psi subunit